MPLITSTSFFHRPSKGTIALMALFLTSALLLTAPPVGANEPVIGGPCQGCELVFQGMPSTLSSRARIPQTRGEGAELVLIGTVYHRNGQPAAGIIVYAYQTNSQGIYPKGDTVHGALRNWVATDSAGQYRFDTIRPAAYPGRTIPEHIHLHIVEPGKGTYYIDSVEFRDDPLLTPAAVSQRTCRGGCGVAMPKRNARGVWQVRRDITLSEGISVTANPTRP